MADYEVKAQAEGGWIGWQTALGTVVGGLLAWQTDMPETLTIAIGVFAGATARPVLGYCLRWLPRPKEAT